MKYKVIVIDDERPALDEMVELLSNLEMVGQIDAFFHPGEALQSIPQLRPDIVFLDIQMPGINGLEFAEEVLKTLPYTDVVFVTAYQQFALSAFDLSATDYLLKPVKPERLQQTLERIRQRKVVAPEMEAVEHAAGIRCFGRFQLNGPIGKVRWSTSKVEEMFAYLCIHPGTSIDSLVDHLFPDAEYDKAKQYIHTCIYQIRKTIKQCSLAEHISIVYDQKFYRLEKKGIPSDLEQFVSLLANNNTNLDALMEAASLYSGELFEGLDGLWVLEQREIYCKQYMELLKNIVEVLMVQKKYKQAQDFAEKLLEQDPFNEELCLLLMDIYSSEGNVRQAKAFFEQFQKQFRNEMGLEISQHYINQFQRFLDRGK